MKRIGNTSSSPLPDVNSGRTGRLVRVPFDRLRPHPANSNLMDEERLEKLAANIAQEGNYPPLVVRPHPTELGCYQVLDGHQRWQVLKHLRHEDALCYVWPCDDRTALILLATLNRLEGQDDPLKRAELLRELTQLASPEDLTQLLPESASLIRQSLELLDLNLEELLADLQRETGTGNGLRAITFVVSHEDERAIEEAVRRAAAGLEGANRRGRALGLIAKSYAER
jgi:ParB-like chromosome segregation protein Spo0J